MPFCVQFFGSNSPSEVESSKAWAWREKITSTPVKCPELSVDTSANAIEVQAKAETASKPPVNLLYYKLFFGSFRVRFPASS